MREASASSYELLPKVSAGAPGLTYGMLYAEIGGLSKGAPSVRGNEDPCLAFGETPDGSWGAMGRTPHGPMGLDPMLGEWGMPIVAVLTSFYLTRSFPGGEQPVFLTSPSSSGEGYVTEHLFKRREQGYYLLAADCVSGSDRP
jgi:hypothetical protein